MSSSAILLLVVFVASVFDAVLARGRWMSSPGVEPPVKHSATNNGEPGRGGFHSLPDFRAQNGDAVERVPPRFFEAAPGARSVDFSSRSPTPAGEGARVPATATSVLPDRPHIGQPWTNSLGMRFVPVPETKVLFCVWETRVKDFAAFVQATKYETGATMYVATTNGWQLRAGDNWRRPGFEQSPRHPVVGVNWKDAQTFCRWLTETERQAGWLESAQRYRLPTDLEWSRAVGLPNESGSTPQERFLGVRDVFPWGTQWPPPQGAGNFDPALRVDSFERTAPVGSFAANRFGIFDLAGNVAEWCEDWWNAEQKFRVLRGAAWNNDCQLCLLSSYRFVNEPGLRIDYYGFRVVIE